MGVHHPLGTPRRTAGVVDTDRLILVIHPIDEGLGTPFLKKTVIVEVRRIPFHRTGPNHQIEGIQLPADRFQEVPQRPVDDQGLGPGMLEDVLHLPGSEQPVDRYQDGADLGNGKIDLQEFHRIGKQHRHPVTLVDARLAQGICQTVNPGAELPVGIPPIPVHHGRLIGKGVQGAFQKHHRRQKGTMNRKILPLGFGPHLLEQRFLHNRPSSIPGGIIGHLLNRFITDKPTIAPRNPRLDGFTVSTPPFLREPSPTD